MTPADETIKPAESTANVVIYQVVLIIFQKRNDMIISAV